MQPSANGLYNEGDTVTMPINPIVSVETAKAPWLKCLHLTHGTIEALYSRK